MTFPFGNGRATDGQEPLKHEADAVDVSVKQGNGWQSRSKTPVPISGDALTASPCVFVDLLDDQTDGDLYWSDSDTARELYSSIGVPR